jgi:beta-galactosidase
MFAWTGFDYRGEPTPYKWPCVTSHFGIMDLCGFPKDGYYAYKAAWTSEPVVHIFPHWNWPGKEGKSMKVQGYSNCEEVELFVNGKSAGKKKVVSFNKLLWDVVYKPGRVEARGYNKGKTVIKDIIETTTGPAQIELHSDCTTLKADGCDVAVISIAIKDAKGRVVPVANNLVKFSIAGPGRILGTGNGNPSSHEPDIATQRMAFNGYCQVLIQTEKQAGEIRLKATSDQLKDAEVILKSE